MMICPNTAAHQAKGNDAHNDQRLYIRTQWNGHQYITFQAVQRDLCLSSERSIRSDPFAHPETGQDTPGYFSLICVRIPSGLAGLGRFANKRENPSSALSAAWREGCWMWVMVSTTSLALASELSSTSAVIFTALLRSGPADRLIGPAKLGDGHFFERNLRTIHCADFHFGQIGK